MIDILAVHRRKLIYFLVDNYSNNHHELIRSFDDWGAFISMLCADIDARDRFISEKCLHFEVHEWVSVCNIVAKKLRFDLFLNPVFDTQTIVDVLAFACRKKICCLLERAFRRGRSHFSRGGLN